MSIRSAVESERDIIQAAPVVRTRRFPHPALRNRPIFAGRHLEPGVLGDVSATVNARLDGSSSRAFLGLRANSADTALTRESDTLAGHLGLALNGDIAPSWRWSGIANYDRSHTDTVTETNAADDRAESTSQTGSAELVASGPIFGLPAGDVSTSLRAGLEARGLESETLRAGVVQTRDLARQRGSFQANLESRCPPPRGGAFGDPATVAHFTPSRDPPTSARAHSFCAGSLPRSPSSD